MEVPYYNNDFVVGRSFYFYFGFNCIFSDHEIIL